MSGTRRQELSQRNAFCINVVGAVDAVLSRLRNAFSNPSADRQHILDQQYKDRSTRHCAAVLRHFVLCRVFFLRSPFLIHTNGVDAGLRIGFVWPSF